MIISERTAGRAPAVSVIIPTINEADFLRLCLRSVNQDHVHEIIVVDGGSSDATTMIARSEGARVVDSPRGRARQMNAGAAMATGDVLLFLHADCTLAPGCLTRLRRVITAGHREWGHFRLRISARHPLFRLIELGSNLRARLFARPYGDQGLFFRRDTFERLGRFPEVDLMEDLKLARAASKVGPPVALPQAITSSARRWERDGIVRRTLCNWLVTLAERRGQSCEELRRRYDSCSLLQGRQRPYSQGETTPARPG